MRQPRQLPTAMLFVAWTCTATPLFAAEIAERPFAVLTASRLDRVLDGMDVLLDVAERPEFSDVLAERYRSARDFAGLDRTRPLGLMRTWRADDPATRETEQPADVLFLPVTDRNELLKTITFDVVTWQQLGPDHVAIDRPDEPYHVLFQDGYAWLGDDVGQLMAFAHRREQILGDIPKSAQIALLIDFDQVPAAAREAVAQNWLRTAEPWLQRRDDESAAAYELRRSHSEWLVRMTPRVMTSTRTLLLTQTLNAAARRSELTLTLQVAKGSSFARTLQEWPPRRTPLARLEVADAASFGVIRGMAVGNADERWSLGWQVFGHPFVQRTAVVAVRGPGLSEGIATLPASSPAEMPLGNGLLRRVTLPATPVWLKQFTGWDPEIWLGQAGEHVWLGFGPPDAARARLEKAYEKVTAPLTDADRAAAARLRLSARDLVGLAPGIEPGWADQQLARGGDQMQIDVTPGPDRLTARVLLDVGVLRVLGAAIAHELSFELDQMLANPPSP